jgi:hypothetical protein
MYETNGYYGGSQTPCTVLVYTVGGLNWYAVEGSSNVNATYDPIENGVNVETLSDVDTATSSTPIETVEELVSFIDEE